LVVRFEDFRARRGETDPEMDRLTEAIIGACIEVHKELGPGLTEGLYEEALCHELDLRGWRYERQVPVRVMYKGKHIGDNRIDLIVEERVIVELKSCDALGPVHRAQIICYLQIRKLKVGLLVNFNVAVLHDGGSVSSYTNEFSALLSASPRLRGCI
jgi:GxxExxY protein